AAAVARGVARRSPGEARAGSRRAQGPHRPRGGRWRQRRGGGGRARHQPGSEMAPGPRRAPPLQGVRAGPAQEGGGGDRRAPGYRADAGGAAVVEAAIAREPVERVRPALREALAPIRLAHGEAAVRILAAQSLGTLHSFDAMPALQTLAADAGASPAERDAAT